MIDFDRQIYTRLARVLHVCALRLSSESPLLGRQLQSVHLYSNILLSQMQPFADQCIAFCLRIINLVPVTNIIIVSLTVMDRSSKSNNSIIVPKTERSKRKKKK